MRVRLSVRFETKPWISVNDACIKSCAQHRQSGAIHFYSCCLWISVDRGRVVTYGEVSIIKLRLTSLRCCCIVCDTSVAIVIIISGLML